eukprot:gene12906-biopygen3919
MRSRCESIQNPDTIQLEVRIFQLEFGIRVRSFRPEDWILGLEVGIFPRGAPNANPYSGSTWTRGRCVPSILLSQTIICRHNIRNRPIVREGVDLAHQGLDMVLVQRLPLHSAAVGGDATRAEHRPISEYTQRP